MELKIQLEDSDLEPLQEICANTGLSLEQLGQHVLHTMSQDKKLGMVIKDSLFLHPAHQAHLLRGINAIKNQEGVSHPGYGVEWFQEAWDDYAYWEKQDRKTLKRINQLITSIQRDGLLEGIGKPEQLHGDLSGLYSRRIDDCNRLVYEQDGDDLAILSCRGHYS